MNHTQIMQTTEDLFTGINRINSQDLSEGLVGHWLNDYEEPEDEIFVQEEPTDESYQSASAYVDLIELEECLELYYKGELDFVDPCNANNDLSKLIPGKTLVSQLDQETMKVALDQLSLRENWSIEMHFGRIDAAERPPSDAYLISLERLSDIVLKML